MRRYYTPWLYAVLLTALTFGAIQSYLESRTLLLDAQARTSTLAVSLEESLLVNFYAKRFDRIAKTIKRLESKNRLIGTALCIYDPKTHALLPDSQGFPASFDYLPVCQTSDTTDLAFVPIAGIFPTDTTHSTFFEGKRIQLLEHRMDLPADDRSMVLVLARDTSNVWSVTAFTFLRTFALTFALGTGLLIFITLQLKHWTSGSLSYFQRSLRSLIAGKRPGAPPELFGLPALKPISEDIAQLAKILTLRGHPRLNAHQKSLPTLAPFVSQKDLVVIANREPYIHENKGGQIEVIRPASGLVTALEPILRQCGGLWIAHASGSADMAVTDKNDQIAVPPDKPSYSLKRVTLTPEEEEGYYYGFSNEGLWPLCHLAHTRPIFRLSDWRTYQSVNEKFTAAIPEDSLQADSLFLVQDYHFALLPKLLKARANQCQEPNNQKQPLPRICLFWHIPWPNPETFGICPWNKELLEGMLGADVIGFHTQYHCNNFLESCNRYLEARVDNEHFSVTMGQHETVVRAFPIGIDTTPVQVLSDPEISKLKSKYKITARFIAVGVDRIDYTKGLIERCEAVERFLEKYPNYVGQFSLVQMGSPSRTHILAYRNLNEQLDATVTRINARFAQPHTQPDYQPIIFLPHHHEWPEIQLFYQLGNICMVTSLHDGMNLVAKEYIWCQTPQRGSLILSKFTGASRELTEAFIVNPYSIEEMADAIAAALAMPIEERTRRMLAMREKVHGKNAYKWASELVESLLKKEAPPQVLPLRAPPLAPGCPSCLDPIQMHTPLEKLADQITHCHRCARLRTYCETIARLKRPSFIHETYWGKPLAGFGDPHARLLIIGLAPAAHGANRTGRVFTGDRSGEWLYRALFKFGFSNQPTSSHPGDGLELQDAYISCVVKCAPPGNKPTPEEIIQCRTFLAQELQQLPQTQVYLALGQIALNALWPLLKDQGFCKNTSKPRLTHGGTYELAPGKWLLLSYHPSQQNTFTGRLTQPMFDAIFTQVRDLVSS